MSREMNLTGESENGLRALKSVDEIYIFLQASEQKDYIGEPVSQLEHALQCADLAVQAKATPPLVLAALLHDIGHLCHLPDAPMMEDVGVLYHEDIGAEFLREKGFSAEVVSLVRGHIEAKRYLVYKNPHYLAKMSEASLKTLEFQGGAMGEEEAQKFERDPLFKSKLCLRQWDEMGKIKNKIVPGLNEYREMMLEHFYQRS